MGTVLIGNAGTDLSQVTSIASGASALLSDEARASVAGSREQTERIVGSGRPVYGVNTGFGRLANTIVNRDSLDTLQKNLLLSHACGTGPLCSREVTRVMMFLRIASLARGRSGIRERTLDQMLAILNSDIYPAVPIKGSLGASGDLAPLAHLSLPLIGLGRCVRDGAVITGSEALEILGLEPVVLGAKEGLALINGTQTMTALTALAFIKAARLADAADSAAAMTLEVLLGTTRPFCEELIELRPHPGALQTAENLRKLMEDSEILISHKACDKVQDAYSLRCVPQVHGATRDALKYVGSILAVELASVTDNPLLMGDGSFVSGGNFHGQPVAYAADHLAVAAAELANISERRIERLLNPDLSGLPAFLTPDPGLNSGYMIAQYTAASLVSENKVLAHPASVDSIPVSGSQEDHVSMGTTAAYQALNVVENSIYVLATELVCAAQAAEFIHRGRHGRGTALVYRSIRDKVLPLKEDRQFDQDIETVSNMISSGVFSGILREL
ncbi:MAG: histidine ammonia-lyase [Candidatus Fermentibacteraceae bacterium]|nr:histidine ammonia-lyase [Candidatus Fermentibacteraceae bacterium]MBN2608053.1 histidine ammonia-lyase [Candidatus Fermentibacteraceae bacterium]